MVLVIDPIRYWSSTPPCVPAEAATTTCPSWTRAPTTDGSRPRPWAWSRTACRRDCSAVLRRCAVSREGLRRRAGADQVAVTVGLVDPVHRGPVLVRVEAVREDR